MGKTISFCEEDQYGLIKMRSEYRDKENKSSYPELEKNRIAKIFVEKAIEQFGDKDELILKDSKGGKKLLKKLTNLKLKEYDDDNQKKTT